MLIDLMRPFTGLQKLVRQNLSEQTPSSAIELNEQELASVVGGGGHGRDHKCWDDDDCDHRGRKCHRDDDDDCDHRGRKHKRCRD